MEGCPLFVRSLLLTRVSILGFAPDFVTQKIRIL